MTTTRRASLSLRANGPLMARRINHYPERSRAQARTDVLTWAFVVERVTGIEPALSAWELVPSTPVTCPDLRRRMPASDRERPSFTGLMAR